MSASQMREHLAPCALFRSADVRDSVPFRRD
jgi:hypothetical protein